MSVRKTPASRGSSDSIDNPRMPAPRLAGLLLVPSLLLVACNEDAGPTVEPRSGTWTYVDEGTDNVTCTNPALVVAEPSTTFVLDYDGGDEFDIEQGEDDIHCTLDGSDFVCPDRLTGTVDLSEFNISIEYHVRAEGSFDSETEVHGRQLVSLVCVGDGCGAFDELPCGYELVFSGEAIL